MGVSVGPILRGEADSVHEVVLSEVATWLDGIHQRTAMIRNDVYKYAVNEAGRGFMLFDMENDPDERVNLIGDAHAREAELEMRDLLLRRLTSTQTGTTDVRGIKLDAIV